jgi:phage gpG-like protein
LATIQLRIRSNRLPAMVGQLPDALWNVVTQTAYAVEGGAKLRAPVDTGALRNSLNTQTDRSELAAQVGSHLEYAAPQEYGFHHHISGNFVPAQPYLTPAAEAERPKIPGRVRAALAAGLR